MGSDAWARHGGALLFVVLLLLLKAMPGLTQIQSERPTGTGAETSGVRDPVLLERRLGDDPWAGGAASLTNLARGAGSLEQELAIQVAKGNRTVIVMVAATQPYIEQTERRLRDRVALHHAAAAADLVPMDGEHLELKVGKTVNGGRFLAAVEKLVPVADARSASSREGVIVVWVGSDLEGRVHLWEKLEAIAALAVPVRLAGQVSGSPARMLVRDGTVRTKSNGDPRVVIVGPPYSGDLALIVRAAVRDERGPLCMAFQPAPGEEPWVRLVSPQATATNACLAQEVLTRIDAEPDLVANGDPRSLLTERCVEVCGRIERPTATDDMLLLAIAEELLARRTSMDSSRWVTLVLVEQDTTYGRSMGQLFGRQLFAAAAAMQAPVPEVVVVPYLRGIDGESVGQTHKSGAPQPQARASASGGVDPARLSPVRADDPPVGAGRVDYIRRLAGEALRSLHEDHPECRVAAVGVLGSDHYDKLMLIQALKPVLQDAVFFTTELDARMLSRSAQPWMRNVLVASPCPLSLPGFRGSTHSLRSHAAAREPTPRAPELEPSGAASILGSGSIVPPLRDSAQVSLCRTLGGLFMSGPLSPVETPHPLLVLHEVGRSRFVPVVEYRAVDPNTDDGLATGSRLIRQKPPGEIHWPSWIAGGMASLIFLCIVAYARASATPPAVPVGTACRPGDWDPRAPALLPTLLATVRLWSRRRTASTSSGDAWASRSRLSTRDRERSALTRRWFIASYTLLALAAVIATTFVAPAVLVMPAAMLVLMGVSLLTLARVLPAKETAEAASPIDPLASALASIGWIVGLAVGLVLVGGLPFIVAWCADITEPIDLWQGVSVIPTASIRLVVALLAVGALGAFWSNVCCGLRRIASRFGLHDPVAEARSSPWLLTWARELHDANTTTIWQQFRLRMRWTAVWMRVMFLGCLWLLGLSLVFSLDMPVAPAGGTALVLDVLCTILFVSTTLALNLVIWDQIRAVNRLIELLVGVPSSYSRHAIQSTGLHPQLAPSLLNLKLIAEATSAPRKMVYVPVALLMVAMISRSSLLDNWVMNMPLYVATSLSVGVAIHGAFLLRSTARRARNLEIARLEELSLPEGPQRKLRELALPTRRERDDAIAHLRTFTEGVFSGPLKDPAVQAVFLPLIPILTSLAANVATQWA